VTFSPDHRNADGIIMFRHSVTTIRRSVLRTTLQSMMSSLVLSRLDYGTATLSVISGSTSSVGDERRCQNDLFYVAFKSHLTVPASAALVESS